MKKLMLGLIVCASENIYSMQNKDVIDWRKPFITSYTQLPERDAARVFMRNAGKYGIIPLEDIREFKRTGFKLDGEYKIAGRRMCLENLIIDKEQVAIVLSKQDDHEFRLMQAALCSMSKERAKIEAFLAQVMSQIRL